MTVDIHSGYETIALGVHSLIPKILHYCSQVTGTSMLIGFYYPHMLIDKVWIYQLVTVTVCCLFVCLFVRLRISAARIRLAASNFARWFMGFLGRESSILGNFAPPEAQHWTNRPARIGICQYTSVPFTCAVREIVRCVDVGSACVYTAVPEDGRTCFKFFCINYLYQLCLRSSR